MVVDMAEVGKHYAAHYGIKLKDETNESSEPANAAVQQLLDTKDFDGLQRTVLCALLRELLGLRSDMKKMRTDFQEERALLRQFLLEDKKIPEPDVEKSVQIVRPLR